MENEGAEFNCKIPVVDQLPTVFNCEFNVVKCMQQAVKFPEFVVRTTPHAKGVVHITVSQDDGSGSAVPVKSPSFQAIHKYVGDD